MNEYEEQYNVNAPGMTGESPEGGRSVEDVEELAEEVRQRGRGFIDEQKATAARSLGSIASTMHETCGRLEQEQPSAARLFGQGADALERLANSLERHDAEELLRQAQDLARREPALMLGTAVAAGFFLTRILKSSSPHTGRERGDQGDLFAQGMERQHGQEEEDSGIILSPNEPVRRETVDLSTDAEAPEEKIVTSQEEHHANE